MNLWGDAEEGHHGWMDEHPTIKTVVDAVCAELNAASASLYEGSSMKIIPVSATDILAEPGKYRPHSDARVLSAIILRKHVRIPYSFDDLRAPTYETLFRGLNTARGGALRLRMVTMCELMREKPIYRGCYVRAVRRIESQGFKMWNTENIDTAAPCQ